MTNLPAINANREVCLKLLTRNEFLFALDSRQAIQVT